MRSVFLISAVLLHISWCYALPDHSWMPNFYKAFDPNFLDRFKIKDIVTIPDEIKISGLDDVEVGPGAPDSFGKPGYYSYSHSHVSNSDEDGKIHSHGETVLNENGKITKFKY